ncbi:Serine/threonine-protein kinase PrkC [Rubripirellula lacrimiformis]|uniref:Serine/threonine-protein kinase PrkC n=1 Tax=Rubripirellula lacrimiformis TaxID=1930273 RepID=A0A517ND76_9BACT|nr:serine/threonine-protein kinase [Rubripirellula lacrimiformis]QDT05056.1 Serine/threonine-protein kinase PrkC [Rubripirellula lacrimiformis]
MTATPAIDDDIYTTVDILASDFIARYRNGDRPTVDEYADRHPDISEPIRRIFPLVLSVEKIKIDQQTESDGSATLAGRLFERLGDFRLVREIGRGGMGIVYEARQESLERTVAIKILPKQSLLDNDALKRFQHEAKTAAAMHHSNIVPIFGIGENDGTHYLVMQLVRGESLDRQIKSEKATFDFGRSAKIARQISDGLAYAHDCGVLHRDIKPANILIDDDGTAQITDFGLARNVSDDPTMSQALCGSPRYMAPERLRGVSDERSDVHAVGLTLYEMISGTPAFENTSPDQWMDAVRAHQVQSLRSRRPDIPVDLDTIVSKAMSPDPADRYWSAADLRDDLDRFLSDEPIHARRTPIAQRFVRWFRRNPRIAMATAVALCSLIVATIASSAGWAFTSAANQRALQALEQSELTTDLALQSLDGVVDIVSMPSTTVADVGVDDSADITWTLNPSPQSAQLLQRIQPLYERLSQQSPLRADIIGQMTQATIRLASIQRQLGQSSAAIDSLERGVEVIQTRSERAGVALADKQHWLASLGNELGEVYSAERRFDEADQAFLDVIAALQKFPSVDSKAQLQLARAHVGLGDPPIQRRRPNSDLQVQSTKPQDHLRVAGDLLESLHTADAHVATVEILRARVRLAESRIERRPGRRRDDFRDAIDILRTQLAVTPTDVALRFTLVEALAGVNLRRDIRHPLDRIEAAARLEESLDELRSLRVQFPDTHVFSVSEVHIRHKLSSLARSQQDYPAAAEQLAQAIAIQSSLIAQAPNNFSHRCWRALLYRSVAEIAQMQGDSTGQQAAIANAVADLDAIDPSQSDHPFVNQTRQIIRSLETDRQDENAKSSN